MVLKGRGPVEFLNRERKARMIESFLLDKIDGSIEKYRILDVGCGNGQISEYFSKSNEVFGVDVEDKRNYENASFEFILLNDESLPFANNYFDIVISHHVIEHVSDQKKHLSEISRVLNPGGLAYLGCPNKSSPFMAGHVGNDSVLTRRDAIKLFESVKLHWEECYTKLLSYPEKYYCETQCFKYIPTSIIKLFRNWYPSHCFILMHSTQS